MSEIITLTIDGKTISVMPGTTVAGAILTSGAQRFRCSVTGEPRGPLCGMGICYECRVTVDGQAHSKSCQILCRDGMQVNIDPLRSQQYTDSLFPGKSSSPLVIETSLVREPSPQAASLMDKDAPLWNDPSLRAMESEILVVGAGPAGMAAAVSASQAGKQVILIDDNPGPGGQIWRGADRHPISSEARRWLARVHSRDIRVDAARRHGRGRLAGSHKVWRADSRSKGSHLWHGSAAVGRWSLYQAPRRTGPSDR